MCGRRGLLGLLLVSLSLKLSLVAGAVALDHGDWSKEDCLCGRRSLWELAERTLLFPLRLHFLLTTVLWEDRVRVTDKSENGKHIWFPASCPGGAASVDAS